MIALTHKPCTHSHTTLSPSYYQTCQLCGMERKFEGYIPDKNKRDGAQITYPLVIMTEPYDIYHYFNEFLLKFDVYVSSRAFHRAYNLFMGIKTRYSLDIHPRVLLWICLYTILKREENTTFLLDILLKELRISKFVYVDVFSTINMFIREHYPASLHNTHPSSFLSKICNVLGQKMVRNVTDERHIFFSAQIILERIEEMDDVFLKDNDPWLIALTIVYIICKQYISPLKREESFTSIFFVHVSILKQYEIIMQEKIKQVNHVKNYPTHVEDDVTPPPKM